jgi:hypothetical protein
MPYTLAEAAAAPVRGLNELTMDELGGSHPGLENLNARI